MLSYNCLFQIDHSQLIFFFSRGNMKLRNGFYASSLLRSFCLNKGPTALAGYTDKNWLVILFLNWTDHTLWLLDVVRATKGRRAQRPSHSWQFYFRALDGMSRGFVTRPFSFRVFLLPSPLIPHKSWLWELISNIEAFISETESGTPVTGVYKYFFFSANTILTYHVFSFLPVTDKIVPAPTQRCVHVCIPINPCVWYFKVSKRLKC